MAYWVLAANSALQNAHLVPTWEEHWFKYHAQEERNVNNVAAGIDDLSNGLAMRADIHTLMDANVYILAPVYGQIVSYFLVWDETYVSEYHLCQISLPTRTSVHHLYSRFAYSVIQNSRIQPDALNTFPIPATLAVKISSEESREMTSYCSESALEKHEDEVPDVHLQTEKQQILRDRLVDRHPEIRVVVGMTEENDGERGDEMKEKEEQSQEPNEAVTDRKQKVTGGKTAGQASDAGFTQDNRSEDAPEYRVKRWRSRPTFLPARSPPMLSQPQRRPFGDDLPRKPPSTIWYLSLLSPVAKKHKRIDLISCSTNGSSSSISFGASYQAARTISSRLCRRVRSRVTHGGHHVLPPPSEMKVRMKIHISSSPALGRDRPTLAPPPHALPSAYTPHTPSCSPLPPFAPDN
ncbi:hypothetical protein BT69DRAFT_1342313 [Atractiella rhizophila]|nr:hypothetical protein BT69DRAFT_1342313 [Atractiella rhizophila]